MREIIFDKIRTKLYNKAWGMGLNGSGLYWGVTIFNDIIGYNS